MSELRVGTRKTAFWSVCAGIGIVGLVSLLVLPVPEITAPGLLAFAGRLHPILIHFPIALIPLLTVVDLFLRWKKRRDLYPLTRYLWALVLFATLASVTAGYLLYASGDYGGELVREHLTGGVILAVLLLLAAGMLLWHPERTASPGVLYGYTALLIAANLALLHVGHHGGSLTHGESFLTETLPFPAESGLQDRPRDSLLVYSDLIAPVLEMRCVTCHNENKTKGDLQLTSFDRIQVGGESGKDLLVAGHPERSELYHRITLPGDDDDVMPPEGKAPLDEVEIGLIAWWIEEGADPEMRYHGGPADSLLALAIGQYIPTLYRNWARRLRSRAEFREMVREFEKEVAPAGLAVTVDPESDPTMVHVSMQIPPYVRVEDRTLLELVPYAESISSLSLAASDITDDALYYIGMMPNLKSLYLPNTAIDGSGLVYLKELPLEVLNVSNTGLTGGNALHLLEMPQLATVYAYNTTIEEAVLGAMALRRPDVDFRVEEGPFTGLHPFLPRSTPEP